MTTDKLDTGLETTGPIEVNFTDYAINKYQSDFTQKTKNGKIKKTTKIE